MNRTPKQPVASHDGQRRLRVRRFGLVPYLPAWQQMQAFTAHRSGTTGDELWLLQHEPVFTIGLNGKTEHVLQPDGIAVVPVDRGGQVTYHGPGQLIAYLLLDLARRKLGVNELVRRLEQAVIDLLADHGIRSRRRPGAPGVYVDDSKVAALGLRVKQGRCYHGLALNVNMDLEPFRRIDPCGYPGLPVTQLLDLGITTGIEQVGDVLQSRLAALLGYTVVTAGHDIENRFFIPAPGRNPGAATGTPVT